MASLGPQFWQWVAGLVGFVVLIVTTALAPPALKARLAKLRWWWLGIGLIVLAYLFLVYLPRRWSPESFPPSALPEPFRPGYWRWMFLFLVGAIASGLAVLTHLRAARRMAGSDPGAGRFPEIDAAWDEIRVRLDQAKIDASSQKFYLLIAPNEEATAGLIEAAGLQVFAHGPAGPAPIHAFATSDGVFLSLSGACNLGAPNDPASTEKIEHLCRRLLALQPDCPVVRGLVVVFPMAWCERPESVKEAAVVRDDIQAVLRVLGVRCPSFAIFVGMEAVPGFPEFAARLGAQVSPQMLDQRVGFAVPRSHEFAGELVQRGLIWQSGWLHVWSLNLLAGDPLNYRVNAELVTLDAEFRRYRRRLRAILESAFSTHQEASPVLFRGGYFVATGQARHDRAFAAGLFRGARSRIVADHLVADWTDEADRADRRYFWASVAIGAVGLVACLMVWFFIATRSPSLGWVGLLGLLATWGVGAFWLTRNR